MKSSLAVAGPSLDCCESAWAILFARISLAIAIKWVGQLGLASTKALRVLHFRRSRRAFAWMSNSQRKTKKARAKPIMAMRKMPKVETISFKKNNFELIPQKIYPMSGMRPKRCSANFHRLPRHQRATREQQPFCNLECCPC